jgi:hypothetical protein
MSLLDDRVFQPRDSDARALTKILLQLYVEKKPAQALAQEAGLQLAEISWDRAMVDVWPDLLKLAAARGRLRSLVEAVARDPNSGAHEIPLALLLERADKLSGDPFSVSLLRNRRRAFIDRTSLRERLKLLAEHDGDRVLIVTGDRLSGKSYSWYLIDHVARAHQAESYLLDFSAWSGPPARPTDVMQEVADQLGWQMRPMDPNEPADTQVRLLLSWFKGQLRSSGRESWLVFDGLNALTMTEEALRLIENITVSAERRAAGCELRVVLVALDRPLPQAVDGMVLREKIGAIGVSELSAFFQNVARRAGCSLDDAAAATLVKDVIGDCTSSCEMPLPELGPRAALLARQIFPVTEVSHA